MVNHFLALGIEEATTADFAVEEAYRYLSRSLSPETFARGSAAEAQAQRCMSRIGPAYAALQTAAGRDAHRAEIAQQNPLQPADFKAFLGHLCVAAGIITLEDLNDAIAKQTDIDLPLGQILQEKRLLSQTELDGLLMGQQFFGPPNKPLDFLTRRLLELTAVDTDMVKIVYIDQRTSMRSLSELLVQRGYVSKEIVQVLETQEQEKSSHAVS